MIDLGLTKLALIGVVALIVIGPEKLPQVARTVGTLIGRMQRYFHEVKEEVSRDMALAELREINQTVAQAATEIKREIVLPGMTPGLSMVQHHHTSADHQEILDFSSTRIREFKSKRQRFQQGRPIWYKRDKGSKMHLLSGSARVAKYRRKHTTGLFSFFN